MPKMKEVSKRKGWATDHRAAVLESVATAPGDATIETIIADAVSPGFTAHMVRSMEWQLRKEGLVGLKADGRSRFITKAGLEWLTTGRFDRAIPEPHERPGARKPRRK